MDFNIMEYFTFKSKATDLICWGREAFVESRLQSNKSIRSQEMLGARNKTEDLI